MYVNKLMLVKVHKVHRVLRVHRALHTEVQWGMS
jgi:hypothetical protein